MTAAGADNFLYVYPAKIAEGLNSNRAGEIFFSLSLPVCAVLQIAVQHNRISFKVSLFIKLLHEEI